MTTAYEPIQADAGPAAIDDCWQLLEACDDGLYAIDRDWRIVTFNPAAEDYFQTPASEVLGKGLLSMLPAVAGSDLGAALSSVLGGGPALRFEAPSPAWPERRTVFKVFPTSSGAGVWFRNVTRERQEEQARIAELEAVYRAAPIGLALFDDDLRYLRCNERLAEINGRPAVEHIGRRLQDMAPGVAPIVEARFREALRTGRPTREVEVRGSPAGLAEDRTWLESVQPLLDEQGRSWALVVSVAEISERKRTEAALAESETKFRVAQELSLDGFMILRAVRNADGEIEDFAFEFVNPAARRWAARAGVVRGASTLVQSTPLARDHPLLFPRYARVLREQGQDEETVRYDGPAGRGWYRNCVIALDGERVAVSFRDITRQIEAENQLRLLVRELEHRGKNTLALIQGLMRLTVRGSSGMKEFEDAFGKRLQVLGAAQSLVTRASGAPLALKDVVVGALAPFNQARLRIRPGVEAEVEPEIAVSLTLALHELATNAVKYGALSRRRGVAEVEWTREDGRLQLVWQERGGPKVEPSSKAGLGLPLVAGALRKQPGSEVRHELLPQGVRCVMIFPPPRNAPAAR